MTTTNALDTIAGAISAESVSLSLQLQMVSAGWNVLSPTQSVSIAGVGAYSLQSINAFAPTVGTYSTNVFSNYLTGINAQQSAFFYVFKPLTTNFLTGPMLPRFLPPTDFCPALTLPGWERRPMGWWSTVLIAMLPPPQKQRVPRQERKRAPKPTGSTELGNA